MADVFISYSRSRAAVAAELAGELADLGFLVWWDTSLLPTGSFGAAIDRELDAAKAVVVIWSPESARSKWVYSEASHADRQDKLINCHTDEITSPAAQIPKPFVAIHSVSVGDIRAIVRALDALGVARSGQGVSPVEPSASPATVLSAADAKLFAKVEAVGSVEAYEFYVSEFPQWAQAPLARIRLKSMREVVEREAQRHRAEAERLAREQVEAAQQRAAEENARLERERQQRRPMQAPVLLTAATRHLSPLNLRWGILRGSNWNAEGRIKGDAELIHGAPQNRDGGGWLLPGAGKTEWFKDLDVGPEMVVVPGDPAFAIGRFVVTFAEWDAAQAHHDWRKVSGIAPQKPNDQGWGRGKRPVIDVSWNDAKAYCAWLSAVTGKTYRLPSEAEWEHACRAGTTTEFWWGDQISTGQANYDGNYICGNGKKGEYRKRTVPVDSFAANPWGLYQVHGNVWEWCEDNWDPSSSSRVLRGGSWFDLPDNLRSAIRINCPPGDRVGIVDFRLARTLLAP